VIPRQPGRITEEVTILSALDVYRTVSIGELWLYTLSDLLNKPRIAVVFISSEVAAAVASGILVA
jgi:hypothetical protein